MKNYMRQKETPAIVTSRSAHKPKSPKKARAEDEFTMTEAAAELDVHRDTLKRWIKEGKVPDARRDKSNSYRKFSREEIDRIRAAMRQGKGDRRLNESDQK